jgi:predicted DNA-binding transcriptional regulator AlpA
MTENQIKRSRRWLRKREVAQRYGGVSDRTVDRMAAEGRIPAPIYRGRFPLWDESELDQIDQAAATAARLAKQPEHVSP